MPHRIQAPRRIQGPGPANPSAAGQVGVSAVPPSPDPMEQLARYYAGRTAEFDEAYAAPELEPDLRELQTLLTRAVAGRTVLEVACGTGYWTRMMARTARTVTATDINESMLAAARLHPTGPAPVIYRRADAWHLEIAGFAFTAGAALFWWSHMPRHRIRDFLTGFHQRLQPGACVVFADHLPGQDHRPAAVRVDADGNLYQRRRLRSGEGFDIIKNYPDETELRRAVAGLAVEVRYQILHSVWVLQYHTIASGYKDARPVAGRVHPVL